MLAETAEFRARRLRREDYSLSDEQQLLERTYAQMLATHTPPDRVRQVERTPDRFDHDLWSRMVEIGASTLGLPADAGGSDASLVEMALVAEQLGRAGAATPFVECAALGRLARALNGSARDRIARPLRAGRPVLSVALHPAPPRRRQLVPCGTVAEGVVVLTGSDLVIVADARTASPANLAGAPIAWWDICRNEATVLLSGTAAAAQFTILLRTWKLLTAATLIGVAHSAMNGAVRYAKDRRAFGVPVGAFQALSHPLADLATGIGAARRLLLRAAWFDDYDPDAAPELAPMATVAANEIAATAVALGVHTQGGFGVTLDSDMQLYFRRARGWPALAGPADRDLWQIAERIRHGPLSPAHAPAGTQSAGP